MLNYNDEEKEIAEKPSETMALAPLIDRQRQPLPAKVELVEGSWHDISDNYGVIVKVQITKLRFSDGQLTVYYRRPSKKKHFWSKSWQAGLSPAEQFAGMLVNLGSVPKVTFNPR